MPSETEVRERLWHILWVPAGFGNNTVKLAEIWDVIKRTDPDSEMYFPTYIDRLREREVMVPLFPNYVFLRCSWSTDLEDFIRESAGIYATFLKAPGMDKAHVMTGEEMDQIKDALQRQVGIVQQCLHVGDFAIGDEVIIKNYQNLTGRVLYFLPPNRAMVQTTMFQQETPIPVKIADLERL